MTKRTRYFLYGSVGVLVIGLGGGLIAYLAYQRGTGMPAGLPQEVRYVPANAEVVAFANVQAVMNSELRRELMPDMEGGPHKGRQMMHEFAGVDLEKQVHHIVAYVEPFSPPDPQEQRRPEFPNALILVQGSFDQAKIEQLIRERAGAMEDYNGKKIFVHREEGKEFAVGLAGPDLIAMGQADLVRRALDRARGASGNTGDITANAEMMNLIRDNAGSTAWVVGQFDAVRRRMRLPNEISSQVPPLRLVSVKANVNGGMKATIRAEAGDEVAAQQLRDVVRGFVSLARLHGGAQPAFESTLKSIELSGTNKTVQMSFAVPPDTLRMIGQRHRERSNPPTPPDPPPPPAPPPPSR
jgi:hypothetical protein